MNPLFTAENTTFPTEMRPLAAPLVITFDLTNSGWDCECCGYVDDASLVMEVQGKIVKSWFTDGHFGGSHIDWHEALVLSIAYAGARFTRVPFGKNLMAEPLSPLPNVQEDAPPLPDITNDLVWVVDHVPTAHPGAYLERVKAVLNGRLIATWVADETTYDDPLAQTGPWQASLNALNACVVLNEHDDVWTDLLYTEDEGDPLTKVKKVKFHRRRSAKLRTLRILRKSLRCNKR